MHPTGRPSRAPCAAQAHPSGRALPAISLRCTARSGAVAQRSLVRAAAGVRCEALRHAAHAFPRPQTAASAPHWGAQAARRGAAPLRAARPPSAALPLLRPCLPSVWRQGPPSARLDALDALGARSTHPCDPRALRTELARRCPCLPASLSLLLGHRRVRGRGGGARGQGGAAHLPGIMATVGGGGGGGAQGRGGWVGVPRTLAGARGRQPRPH